MEGSAQGGLPPPGAPVPLSLLADLQAGLLDDETAARLRSRIRHDPDAMLDVAALDRVRRDLADLGSNVDTAAEVPDAVTARIAAALHAAEPPGTHVLRRGPRRRTVAATVGVVCAVVAVGVGIAGLVGGSQRTAPGAAAHITASSGPGGFPVPMGQVYGLIDGPVDAAAWPDPSRQAACLAGLGFPPSVTPLGERPVSVAGRPALLVVLPGDAPDQVTAVVVPPSCNAIDTGLLAETTLRRP